MSYPQYQQPNWLGEGAQAQQQARRSSPVVAMMAAVLGLGIAGALTWQTIDLLSLLGDSVSRMPAGWTAMIVSHFVVAAILLLGAVLVFARLVAGAVVLMFGAVLTIAAMLIAPVIADGVGATMVDPIPVTTLGVKEFYYQQLFEFELDNPQASLRFVALALGIILLAIAALPPSLNWLRRPRQNGYSAPQASW